MLVLVIWKIIVCVIYIVSKVRTDRPTYMNLVIMLRVVIVSSLKFKSAQYLLVTKKMDGLFKVTCILYNPSIIFFQFILFRPNVVVLFINLNVKKTLYTNHFSAFTLFLITEDLFSTCKKITTKLWNSIVRLVSIAICM